MKNIKQTVTFKASPHEIYEVLMDSKKHSKFTSSKANISRKVGGKFTTYNGLSGKNVQLIPDKKIVQLWKADMEGWPRNHFSKVTFLLKNAKNNTRLTFIQSSVPDKCYSQIKQGWIDYYWKPMKKMLEK